MSDDWIKISGVRTATPNTVYAQQGAKPACQQDISTKFSHLLLAQLPRTQFTHSKAPNRMSARHHHKIFAYPIGTATPNTVYTQQGAKLACQEDINAKFSHLLLAQLPRTQFTHSKAPNPHARKTTAQNFDTSYLHSYPEHSLHTARRQTRMSARHQRKIFASPFGTATPNTVYTQQAAKTEWQDDINIKFSRLLLAQLPPEGGDQRRHPAPQPLLYCACQRNRRGLAPTPRAATPSPQPLLEGLDTAPAAETEGGAQRRHPAPQPLLEALDTAPATETEGGPSDDTPRRNPF